MKMSQMDGWIYKTATQAYT